MGQTRSSSDRIETVAKGVTSTMAFELAQGTEKATSDLKRRIILFLSRNGVASVRRLDVEATDGTVTLRGTVNSFYERQLCLSCQYVAGVRRVVDELKVEVPSLERSPERGPASPREHAL